MRDQGNARLREEHKSARSVGRKLDRKLRNQYFTTQCQTTNQRKLWRVLVLNTVTSRRKKSQIPQAPLPELSRVLGGVVNDPTRPPHLQLPLGPSLQSSLNVFQPVTVTDVESCLKSVDASKATGSDGIPGFLLKQHASVLAPNLTSIINLSLRTGQVPPTFKVSHVSPLFKSGDPTLPQNYRPVSLLPIISRILETMVKRQLTAYLETHKLLPDSQFAYRKQHSTEDALVLAVNRWSTARCKREFTGTVFVDMSKAFVRVKHERLVTVLFSLGIAGTAFEWFTDCLSGRFQSSRVSKSLTLLVKPSLAPVVFHKVAFLGHCFLCSTLVNSTPYCHCLYSTKNLQMTLSHRLIPF